MFSYSGFYFLGFVIGFCWCNVEEISGADEHLKDEINYRISEMKNINKEKREIRKYIDWDLDRLTPAAIAVLAFLSNETEGPNKGFYVQVPDPSSLRALPAGRRAPNFKKDYQFSVQDEDNYDCDVLVSTYMSAIQDIRRHQVYRNVYYKNLHFDVGYLTNEIIEKYQVLLELFHLVQNRYVGNENKNFLSRSEMFYIYTNMVFQGKVIIHLCNMIHELEKKYMYHADTVFFEGHVFEAKAADDARNAFKKALEDLKAKAKADAEARRKKRKQQRDMLKNLGIWSTNPRTLRPKRGRFPIAYGWSIEDF